MNSAASLDFLLMDGLKLIITTAVPGYLFAIPSQEFTYAYVVHFFGPVFGAVNLPPECSGFGCYLSTDGSKQKATRDSDRSTVK